MDYINTNYNEYARKGNYTWAAFFDVDEYLELFGFRNIKHYLANVPKDKNVVVLLPDSGNRYLSTELFEV